MLLHVAMEKNIKRRAGKAQFEKIFVPDGIVRDDVKGSRVCVGANEFAAGHPVEFREMEIERGEPLHHVQVLDAEFRHLRQSTDNHSHATIEPALWATDRLAQIGPLSANARDLEIHDLFACATVAPQRAAASKIGF